MTFDLDDTIAAIATAPGGALRGIVRISGPEAVGIVQRLALLTGEDSPPFHHLATCRKTSLKLPRGLGEVPLTLYLWPTSSSYTRQPSAELHLPGSPPILAAALEAVCLAGARLARPGDFTLRAFLAGRLDLTQAEAVLGVIDAQGQKELDAALAQLAGGLAEPLAALRHDLLELLAHLEAGLDFVEEDIEFISRGELQQQLTAAAGQIAKLLDRMESRSDAGILPRVVLMGSPNAGKSSLLNALAGDDAAIVSEIAGTTRDFVTRQVQIEQRMVLLTDTAGIAEDVSPSVLNTSAQVAAHAQLKVADIVLVCLDASRPLVAPDWLPSSDSPAFRIVVLTKCDLPPAGRPLIDSAALRTSSRTGEGLAELRQAIAAALDAAASDVGVVAGTADRCRESLRLAKAAIDRALAALQDAGREEIIAADLRIALDELGAIVGAVYTEDILDRVFSRFCIGK